MSSGDFSSLINSLSTLGTLSSEVVNYDSSQFDSLTPGYLLGWFKNYRLLERLGEGGMGQTWLAEELSGDEAIQKVVVKVLSKELCGNEEAMEEVRRVFDLTGKLRHPNICATLGMKKDPVFGWILVMDHADGGTLADWFHAQPNHENGLPLEKVLPILRPIAEALDFAHSEGILHRDVKPGNIMFSGRKPILIDFGIAARIRPENVTNVSQTFGRSMTGHASSNSGTPAYMAPEQMMGQPQTGRADQYALAMVLYELLAGKLPFTSDSLMALSFEKARFSPEDPKFSVSVNSALCQALSMTPENRFPTCCAFFDALSDSSPAPVQAPAPVKTEITVPDDVRTLAEAYDRIPAGGKITLRRGTHDVPETVIVRKNITITGEGNDREQVILLGGKENVLRVESGFAEIKNLTFKNEGGNYEWSQEEWENATPEEITQWEQFDAFHSAVSVQSLTCTFENCLFTSENGAGFTVNQKDSNPTVTACAAKDCGSMGFYISNRARGRFTNCEASGNAMSGIQVGDSGTNPTVEKCRFTDGKQNGIFVYDGASGTFTDCEASGNAYSGIEVRDSGTNPTVEKCRSTNNQLAGIAVCKGASGTFTDCEASGNALSGIEVRDSGTNPTVEKCRSSNNQLAGIVVWQGASGLFTNCEASGNANAGIVVQDSGTNPIVTKCRSTNNQQMGIRVCEGASGTFTDCEASGNADAGIEVQDSGTNPTVEKCRSTNNQLVGIAIYDGASGTFTNCEASGNANAGIQVQDSGTDPTVEKCRSTNNQRVGIAVCNGASGTFTDCEASGNTDAGIAVQDSGTAPTVRGCQILNNQEVGIVVWQGASGTFTDCEASGNAESGIEVQDSGTNPTVEKCRSTNNQQAGIWVWQGASGTFTDSEASGNANAGIVVQDSGTAPTVRGCQILNNHGTGILVFKSASGIFRNNRLSGNAKAWDVGRFSSVVREGNVPNSN